MRDVFASIKNRIRSEGFEEGFIVGRIEGRIVGRIVGRIARRREQDAKDLGIMSQYLISYLEQRFSALPDSLKDRIRQVDDIKKMYNLGVCAGAARSLDDFARQLAC